MRVDSRDSPITVRRKSLPKSGAPRHPGAPEDPLIKVCNDIVDRLSGLSKIFAAALLQTGARPQELLNLMPQDIDARGFVHIKALKHGDDRVVLCPVLLSLRTTALSLQDQPLFRSYTYAQFYRSVKDRDRHQGQGVRVHVPVARLFRSAFARGNHLTGAGDLALTARTLGHRRQSSTNVYLGKGGDLIGQDTSRNTRCDNRQGG